MELVELNVEARQGDSGGPIFNQRGELAGVLFGAGQGTTLGSFGPRVGTFLATLAPDIGQAREQERVAIAQRPAPNVFAANSGSAQSRNPAGATGAERPSSPWLPAGGGNASRHAQGTTAASGRPDDGHSMADDQRLQANFGGGWYEPLKSVLAIIGLAAIALRLVKAVR